MGLKWLLGFLAECYAKAPQDLHVHLPTLRDGVVLYRLEVEADETWSFVGKKAKRQWIWLALEADTRQVIAFHVGDRSRQSAKQLWQNIPEVYRHQATLHTDLYAVYKGVIPPAQHRAIRKQARTTNHIERLTRWVLPDQARRAFAPLLHHLSESSGSHLLQGWLLVSAR